MKAPDFVQTGKNPRGDLKTIGHHSTNSRDAELAELIILQLATPFSY